VKTLGCMVLSEVGIQSLFQRFLLGLDDGGDRIRLMTLHTAYVEASRICFDPMTIQKSDMGDLSKPIRCSVCGHFIGHRDLDLGRATRTQVTPDNAFGPEKWENICPKCRGL